MLWTGELSWQLVHLVPSQVNILFWFLFDARDPVVTEKLGWQWQGPNNSVSSVTQNLDRIVLWKQRSAILGSL